MTDDRLRRADTYTHWPDLQAYVREMAAEREPEPDGEIHDDDDGEIE